MAYIQKRASDITGTEAPENDFCTVVVRNHPELDQSRALDVLPVELDPLKGVGDLVTLEIRMSDTTTRELHVRLADFKKWCSDDSLAKARLTRGRVPGRAVNGGNH